MSAISVNIQVAKAQKQCVAKTMHAMSLAHAPAALQAHVSKVQQTFSTLLEFEVSLMSTINHQCERCCRTTYIENREDGSDRYIWTSDDDCGCKDDDWDDDD